MSVQILSLAYGQLQGLTGGQPNQIYQSPVTPVALTTIVKSIRMVNTNTTPVTVDLYLLRSGGTLVTDKRFICPPAMSIAAGSLALDDQEITMASGDAIYGDASVANKVDFVISGIQR
jgi:hypothetical protein